MHPGARTDSCPDRNRGRRGSRKNTRKARPRPARNRSARHSRTGPPITPGWCAWSCGTFSRHYVRIIARLRVNLGGLLNSPPRPLLPARSLGVLIVLALAPLWLSGMFGRGLWTPDEPREADIAWRMSQQSDRPLPQPAGTPFLEKPPLSYWMSGAAISLFGDSAAGARAPNLLYAVITAPAAGQLAPAMDTDVASPL